MTAGDVRLSLDEAMNMLIDAQDERDRLRTQVAELTDACAALNAELARLREQRDQLSAGLLIANGDPT